MSDAQTQDNTTRSEASPPRPATRHALVGGAALGAMALVLGIWVAQGGDPKALVGLDASEAQDETPTAIAVAGLSAPSLPQFALSTPAPVASATARARSPVAATGTAPAGTAPAGMAMAAAPNGLPVFTGPHGVINPLTMLHDPAYYRQWGRVAVTYVNPFAYQQIMNQMLLHSMRAWGVAPRVTVAVDAKATPRG